MDKGSGGCLCEGGEGAGPNRLTNGEGHWKEVGEVGDAYQWEIGQGLNNSGQMKRIDGDELDSSDELNGAGKSPKVNYEAGRAESVSIIGVVEVGGDENGKTVSTNLTWQSTKSLLRVGSKQ